MAPRQLAGCFSWFVRRLKWKTVLQTERIGAAVPSGMRNCAADGKDWCSCSARDKKMRIRRKETACRFRSKQENENYTEEVSQYVPYKTRKCESRGRNQPIGSVQNKKIRIARKEPALRFRAKQENANHTEGTSP